MVMARGSYRYSLVHGWAKLPKGVSLGYTHGVATDSQHNVFVFNQSEHAVIQFSPEGHFLRSWGKQFAAGAHGMTLTREGNEEFLWLTDYALHRVAKYTTYGEEVLRLPTPPLQEVYPSDDLYLPTGVAVSPQGDVYVCDGYGQHYVHRYTSQGEWVQSWGGQGAEPGRMNCPHGVWVDTRRNEARLLVADRANVRIQIYDLDGNLLDTVTENLRYPCGFAQDGEALIIPDLHGRVTILDGDNRLITHLGDNPGVWERPDYPNIAHSDRQPGVFISPHAACVDTRGDLYVVEWVSDGRISKFRRVE
ncbi:hypothetical protein HRbin16_00451 [bacterium HR16]|nr:hypothetical protein HRbin16_00451 [bacterium HR16]